MNFLQITWNVNPEIFQIGGFSLWYYSVCFAIAFLLGYWLMNKMYQKEDVNSHHLGSLLNYILGGSIIGARLGQTLFYEFDYSKNHPLEIILPFRFTDEGFEWKGYQGLASQGGAIGILVALLLFCKKYKADFLKVLDKLVVGVALAGFFIRIGNVFNSEIIGNPASVPWAFIFLKVDSVPRHPLQLYEALAYLIIFFVLWILYQRKGLELKKGFFFGLFLFFVFSCRLLIEFTKKKQEAFESYSPINMGQILSLPFIVVKKSPITAIKLNY